MPDMTSLFGNIWFVYFLGALVGVAAYFWIDYFASKSRFTIKTRPQWEAEVPLSEIFKSGNEIHALLLTGEGIFTRNEEYARHIRRLILPNHDARYLKLYEVGRRAAGHPIDLGAQIKAYGQIAKQKGVHVRYLSDHVGISFLICNPSKPDAWMHIGFLTPFIETDTQPILRIDKSKAAELYDIFWNAYNKLWEMGSEQITGSAIQDAPVKREDGQLANLEIRMEHEHAMRFEGPEGRTHACYLEVRNVSPQTDAEDVEVKVESRDKIDDLLHPMTKTDLYIQSDVILSFERGGQTRRILRGASDRVRFLAFARNPPKRWVQIGEYSEHVFDHRDKIVTGIHEPNRLTVTARGRNAEPVSASFLVQVEHEQLTVRMLT